MEPDGCTLWFPGFWEQCCDQHDIDYAMLVDRFSADLDLMFCVLQAASDPVTLVVALIVAPLMFLGVRAFGWVYYHGLHKKVFARPDDQHKVEKDK